MKSTEPNVSYIGMNTNVVSGYSTNNQELRIPFILLFSLKINIKYWIYTNSKLRKQLRQVLHTRFNF